MAYTQEAQFSFTVQDELGTKASEVVYALADPTKTIANIVTDWQAWASLIVAITSGKIITGEVRLVLTASADQTGKPAAGSRVEQTGVFNFYNASNPRKFGEPVPALADSTISGGAIDLTNTDIMAFVAALHAPSGTAASEPTSNQFLVLTALADAFISFRKRRKQLSRSSYEV